jgi:hypothetical protein
MICSKRFSNDAFFACCDCSSDLQSLLRVFLSDKLFLKCSSDLISLSACQIAFFVEFENDSSRDFELRNERDYDLDDRDANDSDVII